MSESNKRQLEEITNEIEEIHNEQPDYKKTRITNEDEEYRPSSPQINLDENDDDCLIIIGSKMFYIKSISNEQKRDEYRRELHEERMRHTSRYAATHIEEFDINNPKIRLEKMWTEILCSEFQKYVGQSEGVYTKITINDRKISMSYYRNDHDNYELVDRELVTDDMNRVKTMKFMINELKDSNDFHFMSVNPEERARTLYSYTIEFEL